MLPSYYSGPALARFYDAHVRHEPVLVEEKGHWTTLPGGKGQPKLPFFKQASYILSKAHLNGTLVRELDKDRIRVWRTTNHATLTKADDFLMYYGYSLDEFEGWCEAREIDWRTPLQKARELQGLSTC